MDCRYRIWIEDANIQQCRRLRSKNFNGHHLNDSINLEDEENDANEYERIHRASIEFYFVFHCLYLLFESN